MKESGEELTWVSKLILAKLDELKAIMPQPKRRTRKRKAGRFSASPRRPQQRRMLSIPPPPPCIATENGCASDVSDDTITPLSIYEPPVSPASIRPVAPPPPALKYMRARQPIMPVPPPPCHYHPDTWGSWLKIKLEQCEDLEAMGMRPHSYNFIVKLPQGRVLKASNASIKALGYDLTGTQFDATRRVASNSRQGPSPEDIMAMSKSVIKQNLEFGCSKMPVLYERQIQGCPERNYIWVEAYSKIIQRSNNEIIVCMMERNVTDAVLWGQKLRSNRQEAKIRQKEMIGRIKQELTRNGFKDRYSKNESGISQPPSMIPSSPDEPRTPPIYVGDPKVPRFMLESCNSVEPNVPPLSAWSALPVVASVEPGFPSFSFINTNPELPLPPQHKMWPGNADA